MENRWGWRKKSELKQKAGEVKTVPRCYTCNQIIGRGIPHKCSQVNIFENVYNLVSSHGSKLAEQVATKVLLDKVSASGDDNLVLSNRKGGRGLHVFVGNTSENNSLQFSHENALKLRNQLNCSDNHLSKIMRANRTVFGRKSVQPNLKAALGEANHRLESYFDSQKVTVENFTIDPKSKVKTTFYEEKSLIFCSDVDSFISEIMKLRNIFPNTSLIRLGMDGGQGFVKISLNILDKEQSPIEPKRYKYSAGVSPRTQKDSSVKKIICFVNNCRYERTIFQHSINPFILLQFRTLKVSITFGDGGGRLKDCKQKLRSTGSLVYSLLCFL